MSRGRSLNIGVCGMGRLGKLIDGIATERGHVISLRLDAESNANGAGLTREALSGVDAIIDVSSAAAVETNVARAAAAGVNIVVGTTGWDRGALARERVEGIALEAGIGLLIAPNFALGARLFARIVEAAARICASQEELDLWIEEAHHRGKVDHPSGTALALARSVLAETPWKRTIVTELPDGPVPPESLVVSSSRGGYEPGLHRLIIDLPEENIEIRHVARSRRAFALGAVRAAEWIAGRQGVFTMDHVIGGAPDQDAPRGERA